MYERFTDRARKVMQLSNLEAQRFNHEYIGTEHILLGLVKERTGVAASVLMNLDVDLQKLRLEVENIVHVGPDLFTRSKLPLTPRAKKVIEYAMQESRGLNQNYVGTEHLLLGLLREREGVAAQVLMNLGLKLDVVREEVLSILGHGIDIRERETGERGRTYDPADRSKEHPLVVETIERIGQLQRQMEEAVASGDFEYAAALRDEIEWLSRHLKHLRSALE